MRDRRNQRFRLKDARLVVCVRNDDYPAALEPRKIYCSLPDPEAEAHGMIRVIDESGEDYLFPATYFAPIRVPPQVRRALGIPASAGG